MEFERGQIDFGAYLGDDGVRDGNTFLAEAGDDFVQAAAGRKDEEQLVLLAGGLESVC